MLKLQSGSNYRSVKHTAGGALAKGDFVAAATLGGSLNGFIAFAALVLAQVGEIVTWAENVNATKVAGDALAFAPGERVRYNISGAKVSKTSSDPLIGFAKEAALAADTSINIEFDGALAISSGESVTLAQITDLGDLEITKSQVTDLDDLTFAELADVDVAGVTNNDTLKYDAATGKWVDVAVTD